MNNDTIAAIATPIGRGGIGIIKISGDHALFIAESIFRKAVIKPDTSAVLDSDAFHPLSSHRLNHGHIVDPEKERILDEVLLSVMLAPNTYTKEDIVEINTHSGHVVLASILNLVLKQGARLAEPGEFTKRAYLNGRIDLTQAEAVIDIINSRTDKALEIATSQVKGRLKESVESIRDSTLAILTEIEAAIDFPDDVGEIIRTDAIMDVLEEQIIGGLKALLDHYENGHILKEGIKIAIVGRPNVGKSSLLNRLIQDDRAIVTPIPGTTRDLIEETLSIRGIPVIVADTAGLHKTDDPVEVIGIAKTKEYIDGSDLVLFMVDANAQLTSEDHTICETIGNKPCILVVNKSDLVDDDFEIETPAQWADYPSIKISALYGNGLSSLKDLIAKVSIGEHQLEVQSTIIPNLRHKMALDRSLLLVQSAVKEIREATPSELIAIDIQEAIDSLGEIIGITTKEDVIDQIFSRFCIGK
ncbi:MAG: tRNA uridine-5-carboxymethylaminomethyl(34) synthesis GTPase MnmE [Deltaproteobacteria bacterium]|nr:tRNA uridine-5-carboxymethylaminomethyl(34) synthesis GTPase MnmE [Deltaproteobacteria bacterium]